MHRLLVLSTLAVAIVTLPALAATPETRSPLDSIGFAVSDKDGDRAAEYWTPARMAAAPELPLPVIDSAPGGPLPS